MTTLWTIVPMAGSFLFLIGLVLAWRSGRAYLSLSQLKRLRHLYASATDSRGNIRASPRHFYESFLLSKFALLGYNDRLHQFYSFLRTVFLFFLFSSIGFFLLSGFSLKDSLSYAVFLACFSLLLPHFFLWYMVRRQSARLAVELSEVGSYVFDAVSGSHKDLYTALDEATFLTHLLTKPLEHFLNNYRLTSLEYASTSFSKEVPLPETEQFIFLIASGLEYHDHVSLLEYLQVTNQTRHELKISSLKRRTDNRDTLFNFLAMVPALLFMGVLLFTVYLRVTNLMSNTIW